MLDLLRHNAILLLFTIAALGYLVGKVRLGGFNLGVAAVLFVGLAFGAADPAFKLPELVQMFGLVLFVYTVGLSSGPGFFASLGRRGLAVNAAVAALAALGSVLAALAAHVLHVPGASAAGLFAGSLTNTPALAAVVEALKGHGAAENALALPVVAYSISYPLGVIGVLVVMIVGERLAGTRPNEAPAVEHHGLTAETVRVQTPVVVGCTIAEVMAKHGLHVVFSRVRHPGNKTALATSDCVLEDGALVTIVGAEPDVAAAVRVLGRVADEHLELDRQALDFRRIVLSNPELVGVPLRALRLPERYGATITRIRRGDVDFLADAEAVLELGDRVRVVAPRERMNEISSRFGDSYRALGEIDVITFGLGVTLGLLVGSIPLPLPGGEHFSLGLAGGPLVVGLVLGRLGRSGPLVWTMPLSANLTLRQLGLVLFLAGVGSRSGDAFLTTLRSGSGTPLLLAGAGVTVAVASAMMLVARRVLKLPLDHALGILAGLQTQPAALAFALERTKSEQPNVGYATVYPVATITKILCAQLILTILR